MAQVFLSVALATFNEERNLDRCLKSVAGLADEIVVVDGQSSDRTAQIARSFGARVISTPNVPNFHLNKAKALTAARGKWILQLDADEALSTDLKSEIKSVITSPDPFDGYWMPRLNNFLGRFLTKGGQYPDLTLRLYKKTHGHLPAVSVHEQAQVTGRVGYLKNDLFHFGTPDFESYLLRFNRYTSLLAAELVQHKLKISLFTTINYLLFKPFWEFNIIYFRHKGFVDGFPGFVFALFSGLRYGVAYIKYWQTVNHPA